MTSICDIIDTLDIIDTIIMISVIMIIDITIIIFSINIVKIFTTLKQNNRLFLTE